MYKYLKNLKPCQVTMTFTNYNQNLYTYEMMSMQSYIRFMKTILWGYNTQGDEP